MITDRVAAVLKHLNETTASTREAYLDGVQHKREFLFNSLDAIYRAAEQLSDMIAEMDTPTGASGDAAIDAAMDTAIDNLASYLSTLH